MIKYYIICLIFLPNILGFGQETKLSEAIVNMAEDLAAEDSDPEAASIYIDWLNELAENPVMLNSSSESEIARLFFLSDFQIKALIDYTKTSGKIISVFELVNIPGYDRETVEMMIPFISLDYRLVVNPDSVFLKNASITNLSIKSGNIETSSLGSKWRILSKYKFTAGGFSGGFTAEKDPGEKLFNGNPPLPDFLSINLAYKGNGLIRRVIIGDYSARFGLGTNINTGIRTALSLTTPGYMSNRNELKPYTSTDENRFFRGVAAQFCQKNLEMSLFYSKNSADATLGSSSGFCNDYIENLYLAGIHNITSYLAKKDAISDQAYGFNITYNFMNLRTGFTWSGERFSLPFKNEADSPEDIFNFKGDINNLYTISYNALIKRLLLYGEFSINDNDKYAFIQGISFRPSDRLTVSFLCRDFDAGFISFHGNGPGGIASEGNEQSITGNFNFEAAKHLFLGGGCDIRQFKWLKYRCSAPTLGVRQELRLKFLPTEKVTFDASYNYRYSMVDNCVTSGIPDQLQVISKSIKASVQFLFYDNLTMRTRIDYKNVAPLESKGILLLQDINVKFRKLPFTLWIRYCLFKTDTWDSRLYVYENDLLYNFSIPALSGEGGRSYIMIKWKVNTDTDLRIKYSITSLIENGTSTRDNSELKVQFRVHF